MKKLFGEVPRLEGTRVVLDRVVDADAACLQQMKESSNVYRYLPTFLFEQKYEDAHEVIRLLYEGLFRAKESLILGVREKGKGELCGFAEFYGFKDSIHKVSLGYRLREYCWGRGIATETVSLMVDYLYTQTDIEVITASTMVENVASARVLQKNDFIMTARSVEEDWGYPEPTIANKWFC